MSAGSNESEQPVGSDHQPPAVRARKERQWRRFISQYDPDRVGSSKYQRRMRKERQ